MKIGYLMRFWPVFGGGETVTRTLVNEMVKRGHEVTVIYLWYRSNNINEYVDDRVKTYQIKNISNVDDGGIIKKDYKKIETQLREYFKQNEFDIVVNQWLPNKAVCMSLPENTRLIKCHHGVVRFVPTITTLKQRIFYKVMGKNAGLYRVYFDFKPDYVYSDKWILLSKALIPDVYALFPWAEESKLGVVSNPCSLKISPDKVDFNKKKKEIIYVGRIVFLKKVNLLLEIWKKLEDKYPDWCLRIIGDGDDIDNQKDLAKKLGLKRAIFEGYQDAKQYMLEAPILCMTSDQEGFGMVLVEAQQCGCVPVAFDSFPTVHDIIEDGRNGILVENGNLDLYAQRLEFLMTHETERKIIAENGIIDSEKFSVEKIVDQWEKIFNTVEINRGHELKRRLKYITRKIHRIRG